MNTIIIKGRLTRDPELKNTTNGVKVCTISVAVDRSYSKDGERQADFFDCTFWRQGAEFISKYFSKGQEIIVQGEMQSRKYTDKDGNSRTAWGIENCHAEFCGKKPGADSNGVTPVAAMAGVPIVQNAEEFPMLGDDDASLPF